MKILIVENELYLAQSMSNKLGDIGHCDIVSSIEQINTHKHYEIVLLSTNVSDFLEVVKRFKNSVVILLISYFSVDTVITPLQAGASDYIQKPFMIEELIRKIKHQQHYKQLELLNTAYANYINSRFKNVKIPQFDYKKIKLPLIIKTHKQINADTFVFNYLKTHKLSFACIDLASANLDKTLRAISDNTLIFMLNFQVLKAEDRQKVYDFAYKKSVIIHTEAELEDANLQVIELNDGEKSLSNNEILTIDEYVKFIIVNYQSIFPDTDLSKKLGISRKSLWERRKKYELSKKK